MKILFFLRHAGYVRNFEPALRALAERGHTVHVALEPRVGPVKEEQLGAALRRLEALCAESGLITSGTAPTPGGDGWATLGYRLRLGIDYLRYLDPAYADAARLRERAERRASRLVRFLAGRTALGGRVGRATMRGALALLENSIPPRREILAYLRQHAPDLVLVSPLVELGSPQTDYLKAAAALGIPTALPLFSWDNLTNKGLIQHPPDRVLVWNDTQRREAIELHGMPDDRVVVTGASPFDPWFSSAAEPSSQFLGRVGLPADRDYLLYLCSSPFIAPPPSEVAFVRRWLEALRSCDHPDLRSIPVLVRPHPQNATQWSGVDLGDFAPATVYPPSGADPVDAPARATFVASLTHALAVVGLNTTALIEAAIAQRPAVALLTPEFRPTTTGTLHFHYLRADRGGPLEVAHDFEAHAEQLAKVIAQPDVHAARLQRFVGEFVRPNGLAEPAAAYVVAALEGLAGRPGRQSGPPLPAQVLRLGLAPIARHIHRRQQQNVAASPPGAA